MKIQHNEVIGLANLITLEGRWEAHARKHTCLLCWNVGQSPVHQIEDNGTCCLVRTRLRRFLVTCAHVWSGFEEFRNTQNRAQLWISLVDDDQPSAPSRPRLLPNPQLIAKHDGLDLATIIFDKIDSFDARRFCYLRPSSRPTAPRLRSRCYRGQGRNGLRLTQKWGYPRPLNLGTKEGGVWWSLALPRSRFLGCFFFAHSPRRVKLPVGVDEPRCP